MRVVAIWHEHTYSDGRTFRAVPLRSKKRDGFDVYPPTNSALDQAEVARTLDELWSLLQQGKRFRGLIAETGDRWIYSAPFHATIVMDKPEGGAVAPEPVQDDEIN